MSDQQVAFDDWQLQAQKIQQTTLQSLAQNLQTNLLVNQTVNSSKQLNVDNPSKDWHRHHLQQIENIRQMSHQSFISSFAKSEKNEIDVRQIKNIPVLLKSQKQFLELAKSVGTRFKHIVQNQADKTLPQNQLLTFFEEFILYLYPSIEWQNLEYTKDKIKILKKDKKDEETKLKKQKQKEERLKRGQKKQEIYLKQIQQISVSNYEIVQPQREKMQNKQNN